MEKAISLSIPETCGENWKNFTPADQGAFCKSCCKTVVDFTQMSDSEIIEFFHNRKEKTCGRFCPAQLKSYKVSKPAHIKPGLPAMKAGVLGLMLALTTSPVTAQQGSTVALSSWIDVGEFRSMTWEGGQEFTVRGRVTDEYGEAVPGVNVLLKGSPQGTVTDLDGRFEFPGVKGGDILIFTFIGYETVTYAVSERDNERSAQVQIKMEYEVLMGAVAVDDVYEPKSESRVKRFWNKVRQLF